MFALSKDTRSKTFYDWVGVFCFLGCFLATVGLSCLGIANILEKGLSLEAIDALLSMLKLLGLNCSLLLASWAILHIRPEIVLGVAMGVQPVFIFIFAFVLEIWFIFNLLDNSLFLIIFMPMSMVAFLIAFVIRSIIMLGPEVKTYPMPFVRRAISKGVTLPLLISYMLGTLFIATAALGTFGLLAGPASIFGKLAASLVACGTILTLAVAARLLRVFHVSKIVHSRMLLGSRQPSNVTTLVISHHLGSAFFYYALSCIPLMATAIICISIEGWHSIVVITNSLIAVTILLFPICDTICGTRMLILKKSIWDEWCISVDLCTDIPACSMPIFLLQNTSLITSFGALFFARIFGLKLFGNAHVLTPYSILTCTAICIVNNLLFANMAADAPAHMGIYLNARHAANLAEIPESEFVAATGGL